MLGHKLRELRARRAAGESGFTLVELLVVVVIVVALAAIAVPIYLGQKDKAESAAVDGDIAAVGKLITSAVSQEAVVAITGGDKTIAFTSGGETQSVTISEGTLAWGTAAKAPTATDPVVVGSGTPKNGTCIQITGADGGTRSFTVPSGVATVGC